MDRKFNCWEVLACGREPGGPKAATEGVCPASTDASYDGVNGGKNAGRFCWVISGTFCRGEACGSNVKDCVDCVLCPFMQRVADEEGGHFVLNEAERREQHIEDIQRRAS